MEAPCAASFCRLFVALLHCVLRKCFAFEYQLKAFINQTLWDQLVATGLFRRELRHMMVRWLTMCQRGVGSHGEWQKGQSSTDDNIHQIRSSKNQKQTTPFYEAYIENLRIIPSS